MEVEVIPRDLDRTSHEEPHGAISDDTAPPDSFQDSAVMLKSRCSGGDGCIQMGLSEFCILDRKT